MDIDCGEPDHNHDAVKHMEGHPQAMRLSESQKNMVSDLTQLNIKPKQILSTIKKHDPENASTLKTIYNARYKISTSEHKGSSQMQNVLAYLHENGYYFETRENASTNKLNDLFFIHPTSMVIWRTFPDLLVIDATYNTNL